MFNAFSKLLLIYRFRLDQCISLDKRFKVICFDHSLGNGVERIFNIYNPFYSIGAVLRVEN